MAFSLNKVQLIGNLGRDPEIRFTQDGRPMANLNIATSESWTDKTTGERQERTEWHRVVIFNKLFAEVAQKHLHKGSKVYIEGQLQTRKWTDQQGQERYSTEIVVSQINGELITLDRPTGAGAQAGGNGEQGYAPAAQPAYAKPAYQQQARPPAAAAPTAAPDPFAPSGGFDDDIPF